jgi:hypothetical protein
MGAMFKVRCPFFLLQLALTHHRSVHSSALNGCALLYRPTSNSPRRPTSSFPPASKCSSSLSLTFLSVADEPCTTYSEAVDRPRADEAQRHPFLILDPNWSFDQTSLYRFVPSLLSSLIALY